MSVVSLERASAPMYGWRILLLGMDVYAMLEGRIQGQTEHAIAKLTSRRVGHEAGHNLAKSNDSSR